MIVLDASSLIAYLDPRDVHHEAVTAALSRLVRETWTVSALNVAEVMVKAAHDDELLAELSESIADLEPTVVAIEWHDAEPLAQIRARTRLKMPDCCVLRVAQSGGGRVLTTDDALRERARDLGIEIVDLHA